MNTASLLQVFREPSGSISMRRYPCANSTSGPRSVAESIELTAPMRIRAPWWTAYTVTGDRASQRARRLHRDPKFQDVRVTPNVYPTLDELDRFVEAMQRIANAA